MSTEYQAELDRIAQNISNAYAVLAALGAEMPADMTSDNLAATAGTAKALLYIAQKLNADQQAQARANLGIPGVLEDALAQAKEAIVQQVIEALGTPVFGRIESGNKIVLTGNVAPGVYEYWYENEEGKHSLIGTIEHGGAHPDSGAIALAWVDDVKIDKTTGAETADASYARTDHVEVWEGYEYTVSQVKINNSLYSGITICFYDANGNYLGNNELWGATSDEKTATFTIVENAATIKVRLATTATSELRPTSISLSYKKITNVEEDSSHVVDIEWEIGVKIDSSTGAETNSGEYSKSQAFPVEDGVTYKIGCTNCDRFGMGIVTYDANGAFIERIKLWAASYAGTIGENVIPVDPITIVPGAGASSFALRANHATSDSTYLNRVTMTCVRE